MPAQPQSPVPKQESDITFIGAYGKVIPINKETEKEIEGAYTFSDGEHPIDDALVESTNPFAQLSSIDAVVERNGHKKA